MDKICLQLNSKGMMKSEIAQVLKTRLVKEVSRIVNLQFHFHILQILPKSSIIKMMMPAIFNRIFVMIKKKNKNGQEWSTCMMFMALSDYRMVAVLTALIKQLQVTFPWLPQVDR